MPVNKNQLFRLIAIHDRLAGGRHCTLADLLEACEHRTDARPSEKTLYNDLRELREVFGAPLPDRDRSGRPYFYTRPFSLFEVFNTQDAALANEANALLRQLSHLPQFNGLEDVFLKLQQQAGVVGRAEKPVVEFEQNAAYTGLQWLKPLYEAIRHDVPVLLTYVPFGTGPVQLQFSPYLLKEYHNRWHAYGWAEPAARRLNLSLDRIEKLVALPALRRRPEPAGWAQALNHVVGFTLLDHEPLETFCLRVWFPRAHYLLTKPLHASQQEAARTAEHIDLHYRLHWNREWEAALFELGPDAELLEPARYRRQMADKARQLALRYAAPGPAASADQPEGEV